MPLANLDDINQHLPSNVTITELEDDPYQIDAERIIRGYLSNVYSAATLSSWTTPNQTPSLIRSVAGRLIAAWWYGKKVSGESAEWNEYSDQKYKEALLFLERIQSGDLVLVEVEEDITIGDTITSDDFWPNNDTPVFSMDQQFA